MHLELQGWRDWSRWFFFLPLGKIFRMSSSMLQQLHHLGNSGFATKSCTFVLWLKVSIFARISCNNVVHSAVVVCAYVEGITPLCGTGGEQ